MEDDHSGLSLRHFDLGHDLPTEEEVAEVLTEFGWQDQLAELYQQIHCAESAELLGAFERMVLDIIRSVRHQKTDRDALEKRLRLEKNQYEAQLRQLEDEIEVQVRKADERARVQERQKAEHEREGLRERLTQEIAELQSSLTDLSSLEAVVQGNELESFAIIKQQLATLVAENREMQFSVTHAQANIDSLRSREGSVRQELMACRQELNRTKSALADSLSEQEALQRQILALRGSVSTLQDTNDDLRMSSNRVKHFIHPYHELSFDEHRGVPQTPTRSSAMGSPMTPVARVLSRSHANLTRSNSVAPIQSEATATGDTCDPADQHGTSVDSGRSSVSAPILPETPRYPSENEEKKARPLSISIDNRTQADPDDFPNLETLNVLRTQRSLNRSPVRHSWHPMTTTNMCSSSSQPIDVPQRTAEEPRLSHYDSLTSLNKSEQQPRDQSSPHHSSMGSSPRQFASLNRTGSLRNFSRASSTSQPHSVRSALHDVCETEGTDEVSVSNHDEFTRPHFHSTRVRNPPRIEDRLHYRSHRGFSIHKPTPFVPQELPTSEAPSRVFKIILIGDAAVGKTSFITRFCTDTFVPGVTATLGVDFQTRNLEVQGELVTVQLWDTAGQERFRSIGRSYFRRADGAILMYDVTYEPSFTSLRNWMQSLRDEAPSIPTIICANKTDLRYELLVKKQPCVDSEQGSRLARQNQCLFHEASAKDGENVLTCVSELTRLMMANEDLQARNAGLKLGQRNVGNSKTKPIGCKFCV